MLLPAILSISIVGVPFLIISLWYYFSLQHQQQKKPVFEIAVIDQNGLDNIAKCDDLEEKNQQIEFPSEEQVIICDDGIRRSIEPLKQAESNEIQTSQINKQIYQELKQQFNPVISTIKCSQGTDKDNQTVTQSIQQQQKAQNIPSQETSKPQDPQQNSNTKDLTQKENTDPNEDEIIIDDAKKQNQQQTSQKHEPKSKQDHNHKLENQEESDNGKQAITQIKQSLSLQKTQNILQTNSQTVLNQNQKAKPQIKGDEQNSNGMDQKIQNQMLIEQAQQAPPIYKSGTPFSNQTLNAANQVLGQKEDQIDTKNPQQIIQEDKKQNFEGFSQQQKEIEAQKNENFNKDQIIIDDAKKQNQQEAFQKHKPKNQEETDNGNQAMTQSNQSSSKKKISILPSQGDSGVQYPSVIPDPNENSKKEYSTPGNQTTNPIPKHNHETPDGDPKDNPLKSNQLLSIKGNELQQQSLNKASLLTNQQTLPIKVIQNLRQDQNRLQPNYLQTQQNQQAVTIVTEQQSENDQRKNMKQYNRMQNIFLLISCIIFVQSIIGRIYVKNTKNKIETPQFFILSAINTGFVIILYNFIYSGILCVMALCSGQRAQEALIIARFCFVFYGLIMTFPIYAGLDDFITLDFITSIIAIIYSFIIQYLLMKIKVIWKWPTHIQFGTLQ